MDYFSVPEEISVADMRSKGTSWSPGMFERVIIPTSEARPIRDLLDPSRPYDRGVEPGSMWYMRRSTRSFIRTRALQAHTCLLYPKGDAVTPVNPRVYQDPHLVDGDILMSKDSNVGECAMVDGANWQGHMFSGGILRLHPSIDRYYFFAFLKHPLFKAQLQAKVPRGATIRHAKSLWLDCLVPFPNQSGADRVVRYVSALMQAIVEKEKALRCRHKAILCETERELSANRRGRSFVYSPPTLDDLRATLRLDTGLYCQCYREYKHNIERYTHGARTLPAMGVKSRRGPNLAVSVIGKSLYSKVAVPGMYQLILPANISEYGVLTQMEWLGTKRSLPTVNQGEIVFGCEATWRSLVVCEAYEHCTTNFHGTILYWPGAPLEATIWLRCMIEFMRNIGFLRYVAVGGQGGHLSPEYFDYLLFPNFPENKMAEIARLYRNSVPPPKSVPTLGTFVDWHRRWNEGLGIWELDREIKALQRTLLEVQEQIIDGNTVTVPLADGEE